MSTSRIRIISMDFSDTNVCAACPSDPMTPDNEVKFFYQSTSNPFTFRKQVVAPCGHITFPKNKKPTLDGQLRLSGQTVIITNADTGDIYWQATVDLTNEGTHSVLCSPTGLLNSGCTPTMKYKIKFQ